MLELSWSVLVTGTLGKYNKKGSMIKSNSGVQARAFVWRYELFLASVISKFKKMPIKISSAKRWPFSAGPMC